MNIHSDPLTIHVIADYGPMHDLAFAEVKQRIRRALGSQRAIVETYAVPAFDTLATGFVLAQLSRNPLMEGRHIFYVNTAPRRDNLAARVANAGEALVYAQLESGAEIVAVNSGYTLSFVADALTCFCRTSIADQGSQFRSRDLFPAALAMLTQADQSLFGSALPVDSIPTLPAAAVAYVDGYGNLKTTLSTLSFSPNKQVTAVTINGVTRPVSVADGIFSVPEGELVLAPGSSGWKTRNGEHVFYELCQRGGSAAAAFGGPVHGLPFTLHQAT